MYRCVPIHTTNKTVSTPPYSNDNKITNGKELKNSSSTEFWTCISLPGPRDRKGHLPKVLHLTSAWTEGCRRHGSQTGGRSLNRTTGPASAETLRRFLLQHALESRGSDQALPIQWHSTLPQPHPTRFNKSKLRAEWEAQVLSLPIRTATYRFRDDSDPSQGRKTC